MRMLKKGTSCVLAQLSCSRTRVRSARQRAYGLARGKGRPGALGFGRVKKRTFLNIPKCLWIFF